jgi:hypothetical protein
MNDPSKLVKPFKVAATRDSRLPVLYQVTSHPLLPNHKGRIFVYEQQASKKIMKKIVDLSVYLVAQKRK